jgi:hypothetical protein
MRVITKKLLACAAVFGLLLAGVPALAESLSASGALACCNTIYCPLHPRQARDLQKDKSNCDAQGHSKGNDCSMRACDPAPNPAVEIVPFVLIVPVAIALQASVEPAPLVHPSLFRSNVSIPSTPPPRILPS